MKAIIKLPVFAALVVILSTAAFAQSASNTVKGEILGDIDVLEKKFVGLAEAVPADKYGWRPEDGVRSVSEVFMHVAGANYGLPSFIGAKAPADVPKDMEKITDKAEVVKNLKASFEFFRSAIKNMSDADIEKTNKMFGKDRTYREIGFFMTGHLHEHLGQSIAYARANRIVPPWSR